MAESAFTERKQFPALVPYARLWHTSGCLLEVISFPWTEEKGSAARAGRPVART